MFYPIAVIVLALSFGAYSGYQAYLVARDAAQQAAAEEAKLLANEEKITKALANVRGLDRLMLQQGFWYTFTDADGNQSVFYFDLASAARQDLDDSQLASLVSHIQASSLTSPESIRPLPDISLPPALQFHNALYQSAVSGTSTIALEEALQKKENAGEVSSEDLFQLSYLEELKGNYAQRDALNARNCKEFQERCEKSVTAVVTGLIEDKQGGAIEGASVEVVSRPEIPAVHTDINGAYRLVVKASDMEKLRIHAHKRNFSDGYADAVVLEGTTGTRTYRIDDIRLESPIGIVTIDFDNRAVTGLGNSFGTDGSVTLKTSQSTYMLPKGALVHEDGTPYTGDTADVYLYEFFKGDPPRNLTQLDTFDQVRGYAGNLMKSFGMPYIQFFAPSGEELHVLSSNPMLLTYTIPNMEELRENSDKIYRPLTDADMEVLVRASAQGKYPIDRQFLIDNQMLQFPAFWVFDRKRGVWYNVGISVLNTQGTIQTVFYTIRSSV